MSMGDTAAKGVIRIALADARQAEAANAALRPDSGPHMHSRAEGAILVLEAEAGSPMGLLRTFDDALACLRATGVA